MEEAKKLLTERFKLQKFRNNQEGVIRRILEENKSALTVMPTGSGKSLCFQLPALCFSGLTLVISPLLALMKDQVDGLVRKGIPAGRLDSHQTREEHIETMEALNNGTLKLLYVAPERLNMEGFMHTIANFNIDLMAVDESHCVSEWGDAFRPDYLKIARFAKENDVKRVLCLTATATPKVAEDICRAFDIDVDGGIFRGSTYRSNLHLCIESVHNDDEGSQRIHLAAKHCKANPGPTIVYVTTQKNTENVANSLANKFGISAKAYHAGMEPKARQAVQEWFMTSDTAVVCATIAFGMGVDKSNIRNVIHFNLPKTLEGYSQEIGRAGRDGLNSKCIMYLEAGDRSLLENFARGNTPSKECVRGFMKEVCFQAKAKDIKKHDVLVMDCYKLSKDFDIRDVTLSLLFAQLELQFGFIRAITPMYMVFTYKAPQNYTLFANIQKDTTYAAKAIRDFTTCPKTVHTVDVERAAEVRKIDRGLLVAKLNEWSDAGWIDLTPSQRRNRYHILKELPTDDAEMERIADEMFARMHQREQDEVARMQRVFDWAAAPQCLAKGLCDYFGDMDSFPEYFNDESDALEATSCGRCTVCVTGKPATTYSYVPPPFDDVSFHKILGATDVRDDARFLARLAFGITSPRITTLKLSKHEVFGSMCSHRWEDLLERFQAVVDAAYPDGVPPRVPQLEVTESSGQKRKAPSSFGSSTAKKPYGAKVTGEAAKGKSSFGKGGSGGYNKGGWKKRY